MPPKNRRMKRSARKTRKRILALSASFLTLAAVSCLKKEEMGIYRFIDHLDRESILRSPFLDFAEKSPIAVEKNSSLYEIAGKNPLLDAGSGENPFLIKKKLSIGPAMINAILSPPVSQYKFDISIPEKAVLEFTYGIRRDRDLEMTRKGQRTVEFSIAMETDRTKTEVFSSSCTPIKFTALTTAPPPSMRYFWRRTPHSKKSI